MKKKLRRTIRHVHEGVKSKFKRGGAEDDNVPRITNENLAEHREDVLASSRKFIYPLTHSKHKIVIISTSLIVLVILSFFTYILMALYRYQSTSDFMYRVTKVMPVPVARAGGSFVSYESYLFELRHYIHYYESQENLDFASDKGRLQLAEYRKRSLDYVINNAYIQKLARQYKVGVTDTELSAQIDLLRSQNRLGGTNEVFEDVLKNFWGWSVNDFKRRLRQELLAQKLLPNLDTETRGRAQATLDQLKAGADFTALAKTNSDDTATKDKGGEFGFLIERGARDIPAATIDALFKLKAGQVSGLVDVGYGIEILKVLEVQGNKVRAARILFNYKDINSFINDLKAKQKTTTYIKI